MGDTNEVKARKFLQYIADNMPKLRKALAKNITYNEDLFDDAIQESILKIYNSIIKNGTDIDDYEQYFFIVSKYTYIYCDNKKKKADTLEVRDLFDNGSFDIYEDDENNEERFEGALTAIEKIRNHLIDEYGEEKADIYLTYINRKANGRCSYKSMSKEYKMSVREISAIINEIKSHVNDSETIKKIKKDYKEI